MFLIIIRFLSLRYFFSISCEKFSLAYWRYLVEDQGIAGFGEEFLQVIIYILYRGFLFEPLYGPGGGVW